MSPQGFDEHLAGWSALHGDHPPSRLVRGYVRVVHRAARPLAAVPPDALTLLGGALAVSAVPVAATGPRWLWLVVVLVLLSTAADALDGAVAVVAGRASRWGAVLDAVTDRVADAAFLAVLWLAGAPGPLCAAAGLGAFLLEYARARAGAAGMAGVGVISVAERPARIVVTVLALVAGAALGAAAVTAGVVVLTALTGAGLVQILAAVRRHLAAPRTP